jgi:hypothetical protein
LPEMVSSSGMSPIHPSQPRSNFGKAKNSKTADRAEAQNARNRLILTNLKISSVLVVKRFEQRPCLIQAIGCCLQHSTQ